MMVKARQAARQEGVFTGWHMLTIMVLFFGTVIAVNLFMAWNATRSWSGLVVKNTYVGSRDFNDKIAEARAFAATGITGTFAIEPGRVVYTLADAKGAPLAADGVTAIFKRPVAEREDFSLDLLADGGGRFSAEHAVPAGQWVIDISTLRDGQKIFHHTLRTVAGRAAQ